MEFIYLYSASYKTTRLVLCSKYLIFIFFYYILILHLTVAILLGKQYLTVIFPFSSLLYDILHRLFLAHFALYLCILYDIY